jgi:hypothetical protein
MWILRLDFMYNLIRFTDFRLDESWTIILDKHDTTIYNVMTRPLIWTAGTADALWSCIHWVVSDTADIAKISLFLPLLQNNFGLLPRVAEEGFKKLFSELIIVS